MNVNESAIAIALIALGSSCVFMARRQASSALMTSSADPHLDMQDHSIDERNEQGETLLHVSCALAGIVGPLTPAGPSTFIVKKLLQAGADPNAASAVSYGRELPA